VFKAYLTTFLIETGYEKPIKTLDQMSNSETNFGFIGRLKIPFPDTSDSVDSANVKDAVYVFLRGQVHIIIFQLF